MNKEHVRYLSLSTSDGINRGAAITLLLSFHLSADLSINLFPEISQFVCNESLHHGPPRLSLSIFAPVFPSCQTSPPFLANIALFSQFFISYYLISRLVLPQSIHLSILPLPNNLSFLLHLSYFSFSPPIPHLQQQVMRPVLFLSPPSVPIIPPPPVAQHLIFTSSFSSLPLCLPSFLPFPCHVLFDWHFSLLRTM